MRNNLHEVMLNARAMYVHWKRSMNMLNPCDVLSIVACQYAALNWKSCSEMYLKSRRFSVFIMRSMSHPKFTMRINVAILFTRANRTFFPLLFF